MGHTFAHVNPSTVSSGKTGSNGKDEKNNDPVQWRQQLFNGPDDANEDMVGRMDRHAAPVSDKADGWDRARMQRGQVIPGDLQAACDPVTDQVSHTPTSGAGPGGL